MAVVNYSNYLKKGSNYSKPEYLKTILEDTLDTKLEELKKEVIQSEVVVTEDEIRNFLTKTLEEENPELKVRIESPKVIRNKKMGEWKKSDFNEMATEVFDKLSYRRYEFDSYTLDYFKKYVEILKNKAILLLDIIDGISTHNYENISDNLIDLDIQLDKNGNILHDDIKRLINPTISNIKELREYVLKANTLTTYLTFKMTKESLEHNWVDENYIYPTVNLQEKSIYDNYFKGNVALSSRQYESIVKNKDMELSRKISY